MSWICENCSSYNPDTNRTCFVCDAKKSRAAVRKSRLLERERRLEEIKEPLYNALHKSGIIIFYTGVISCIVVALISLCLILFSEMLNDMLIGWIMIIRRIIDKIVSLYSVNCKSIVLSIIDSAALQTVKANLIGIGLNISSVGAVFISLVKQLGSLNLDKLRGFVNTVGVVAGNIQESVSVLFSAMILLAANLLNRFNDVFAHASGMFQSLSEKFRMLVFNTQSVIEPIGEHLQTAAVCVQTIVASLIDKFKNIVSTIQAIISLVKSRVEQTISNVNYIIQKSSDRFSQFENIDFN